jgi:Ca2+-transporting ATPase
MILVNRSRDETVFATIRRPNPALGWIVGATLLGLACVFYLEPFRNIFRFGPLTGSQVLLSVAAAVAGLAWLEFYKGFHPPVLQVRRE